MSEGETESVRFVVEVVAGLLPGKDPDPDLTRRFVVGSTEWRIAGGTPGGQSELLATVNGKAQGYAALLMMQPDRLNWVRTDWVWL